MLFWFDNFSLSVTSGFIARGWIVECRIWCIVGVVSEEGDTVRGG